MQKALFILLCIISLGSMGQSVIETGIQVSGGWFFPAKAYDGSTYKNGMVSGAGVYAAVRIWKPLSLVTGAGFQYKVMQEQNFIPAGGPASQPGYPVAGEYRWDKFQHHSLLAPIKLRLALTHSFFIQSGMEVAWLTNYSRVNEKPETNWTIGVSSRKHKLKWSLDYSKGFKDQGLGETVNGVTSATIYRNQMLQFSLYYPLWQK